MISLKEDELTGLTYRQWASPGAKAAILLIHGLGAHSGRWEFLARFLIERGISSYAIELRGFGGTKGLKGHVDSFDIYFNDILRLRDIIKKENAGKKVFLAGESMGAVIAILAASQAPEAYEGLICLSPAIVSRLPFSFLDYIRIILLLIFNPKKQLDMPFSSVQITHDTEYQKVMDSSPLEHRLATPRMLSNIAVSQLRLGFLKNKLHIPSLFLIAADDKLVDKRASKFFFKSLTAEDKELIEYPGMYHSLSVEFGKEKVFEDMFKWMAKRI